MTSNKPLFNKAVAGVILLAFASCTILIILQNSSLRIDSVDENTAEISYSSPHNSNNANPDNNFIDQIKHAAKEEPTSFSFKADYYANLNSMGKGVVYDMPMPKNNFLLHFTQALRAAYKASEHPKLITLVVRNMTLYCPRNLRKTVKNSSNGWMLRARAAVEMIQTGLDQNNHGEFDGSFLPIFVLIGDGCGCSISDGFDKLKYPRLSWPLPARKYSEGEYFGSSWCQSAIGIPSYEIWFSFHGRKNSSSWDATFAIYSEKYPWNSKLKKAVWRGATTYEKRYGKVDLNETPRGKLVHLSLTNSGLIDAAFVKLIQQYEGQEDVLTNQTILADRMRFDDQMKYKAIIDIDGNNWSSRFSKLLCTNSVVIKVDPDYIEYFYDELKPNQHYVPASLDNLTNVTAYVLDENNEDEMKRIVDSANSWCKRKMTENQLAKDTMLQLRKYKAALDDYMDAHNINVDMIELLSRDLDKC